MTDGLRLRAHDAAAAPAMTTAFDGPSILASLNAFGLATDLSSSDLSLSLASSSKASSSTSTSSSSSNSSLSMLLSRLSLLLSDLSRLIETQIKSHLPLLLAQTSRIQGLQSGVHDVRSALTDAQAAVQKVRAPAQAALRRLERDQRRLRRLGEAQKVLKEAGRFVLLARRLERNLGVLFDEGEQDGEGQAQAQALGQDEGGQQAQAQAERARQRQRQREEALVRSARAIEAIADLVEPPSAGAGAVDGADASLSSPHAQPPPQPQPLARISFVQAYLPSVSAARNQVLDTMEQFIVGGLRDLAPSTLSASLLTASVLGVLEDLVRDLMSDLTDVVRRRVEVAWRAPVGAGAGAGPQQQQGQAAGEEPRGYASYKPRTQRGPGQGQGQGPAATTATASALDDLLARLETLFAQELTAVCSKIYLLQRVLGLMRTSDSREDDAGGGGESRSLLDKGIKVRTKQAGRERFGPLGIPQLTSPPLPFPLPSPRHDQTLDDQTPTSLFWQCLAASLSASRQALPTHLQQALLQPGGAPARRLEGLVNLFFEKTSIWTGIEDHARRVGEEGRRQWEVEVVWRSVGLAR